LKLHSSFVIRHFLLLAGLCSLFTGLALAQTEIWTKITATPGAVNLGISLAPFGVSDPSLSEASNLLQATIHQDLVNSLFFALHQPDSDKVYASDAANPDFAGWGSTGASILLAGDVSARVLTIRLYDLISKRLVATKDYTLSPQSAVPSPQSARELGHRVADEIIKLLTGEEGIAQTRVAFCRRQGEGRELYVIAQDGTGLKRLTSDGRLKYSPDWSPDGNRIAYSSYYEDRLLMFAYDVSTGVSTVLCDAASMNDAPAWSPDGGSLAASLSTGDGSELYCMDAAGNHLHQVTYNGGVNTSPVWSPSGQQIAFVSDRDGSPQIYIVNQDGTAQRRLTYEGTYNTTPAWSSRGDVIAYSSRQGGANQIYITDLNGEAGKQLTFAGNNVEPCFSPDGLHIAFVSSRTGSDEIIVMNWDGTDQRQLTSLGGCSGPSWSPSPER
jgi:TolB protein